MIFLRNSFIGNWVRDNRKKISREYFLRWVQCVDYEEYRHPKYKYYLLRNKRIQTKITGYSVKSKFFHLDTDGLLTIYSGYCWDGPSGPTIDTASFMRSSGVHDVFFQMLRDKLIPTEDWNIVFELANSELKRLAKEDGMMWPRYNWVKFGVDKFGAKHAKPAA